jgi:hypothetical protein
MLDRTRREFITVLGCAAAWPLAARAQQPAMPVVGILSSSSLSAFIDLLGAFRQGLKETGYIEGRNITIESRWAEGRFERLPELAAELVQRRAAVIVTTGEQLDARDDARRRRVEPLWYSSLGGSGGGGLPPRYPPLSDLLVPAHLPGARQCALYHANSGDHRHRLDRFGFHPADERISRSGRMALALPAGRPAGGRIRDIPGSDAIYLRVMLPSTPAGRQCLA